MGNFNRPSENIVFQMEQINIRNRPSENIVFQMEQINIRKVDISVVSER